MSINVTDDNFLNEVIEKSKTTPVMVDFWAEWCGPCRMLGPVLEKVEKNFGGRFILAKLDTDHNQKTAGAYQISGIPAVKLFINGSVVDEFTGALSEQNVLQFIEKHIADPVIKEVVELAKNNVVLAAERIINENLKGQIVEEVLWHGVKELLKTKQEREKLRLFAEGIPVFGSKFSDGGKSILYFLDRAPSLEDFEKMSLVAGEANVKDGLDYFLGKVENAGDNKDQARENLLACFFLIGTSEQIVNEYRKKLSALLY